MAGAVDALILGLDGQRSRDAYSTAEHLGKAREAPTPDQRYLGILFRFGLEGMMDRSGADCSASTVQTIWPSMAVAAKPWASTAAMPW